jgi:hypothetical protein
LGFCGGSHEIIAEFSPVVTDLIFSGASGVDSSVLQIIGRLGFPSLFERMKVK